MKILSFIYKVVHFWIKSQSLVWVLFESSTTTAWYWHHLLYNMLVQVWRTESNKTGPTGFDPVQAGFGGLCLYSAPSPDWVTDPIKNSAKGYLKNNSDKQLDPDLL